MERLFRRHGRRYVSKAHWVFRCPTSDHGRLVPKSKPKCVIRVGLLMGLRPNATRRVHSSHVLLHAGRHRCHLPAYHHVVEYQRTERRALRDTVLACSTAEGSMVDHSTGA